MKKLTLMACLALCSAPLLHAQTQSAPPATGGTSATATANTYALFKVEDANMKIRSSDGSEAGEIQYLVIDPTTQRVVSVLVSGGMLKEKLVALPFASLPSTWGKEMTLTTIDKERFQNAPSIDRAALKNTQTISRDQIDRGTAHFGGAVSRSGSGIQPEPVGSGPGQQQENR